MENDGYIWGSIGTSQGQLQKLCSVILPFGFLQLTGWKRVAGKHSFSPPPPLPSQVCKREAAPGQEITHLSNTLEVQELFQGMALANLQRQSQLKHKLEFVG